MVLEEEHSLGVEVVRNLEIEVEGNHSLVEVGEFGRSNPELAARTGLVVDHQEDRRIVVPRHKAGVGSLPGEGRSSALLKKYKKLSHLDG